MIDSLSPLLADSRRGVPEAMLSIFGQIGTEHAVDLVIQRAGDDRPAVRSAAITALGSTQSKRAEDMLLELARKGTDADQGQAIAALGKLGSDRALAGLVEIPTGPIPISRWLRSRRSARFRLRPRASMLTMRASPPPRSPRSTSMTRCSRS